MRLGGSVPINITSAEEWISKAADIGYRSITWPIGADSDSATVKEFKRAADKYDITVAEVGAWYNPLSPNDSKRSENIAAITKCLAAAEEIGANCCVNIAGARGEIWDSCYAENYASDTYALIVDTVRGIIDAVKPERTFYTLESMPWMFPDSIESYQRLIRDIDRTAFAVHLDFVNMMNTPKKIMLASEFVEECLRTLGKDIKSVHIKDVKIDPYKMPCHISECSPGEGILNYAEILGLLDKILPQDTPVLLEHMTTVDEYRKAYNHLKNIADENNITV